MKKTKLKGDFFQRAGHALKLATGEIKPVADTRNAAAVALGALGASKGGKARAVALSATKRKAIAQKAAQARWNSKPERKPHSSHH